MARFIYIIMVFICAIAMAQTRNSVGAPNVADTSDTAEYHYFIDKNKNGVDDRLEQRVPVRQSDREEKSPRYKDKETKPETKSSSKTSERERTETNKSGRKQNNQRSRTRRGR